MSHQTLTRRGFATLAGDEWRRLSSGFDCPKDLVAKQEEYRAGSSPRPSQARKGVSSSPASGEKLDGEAVAQGVFEQKMAKSAFADDL
ncbi:MAG: hypothetical protein FWC42_04905 [Proteobacteria bacterium]|nr:hypothetical protein [Pseudomonadota bacterium]